METALRGSDAVVGVISGGARDANVYFEIGAAVGANKRLILVVDPSSGASMPFDLRGLHYIALQAPEETAREVAEAIGAPS